MSGASVPIRLYKGEDAEFTLTVRDEDDDGNLVDLTGLTIEMQVKAFDGADDPAIIERSVGDGITILTQSGNTLGQFTLTVPNTETSNKPAGKYRYDVVVVDGSGGRHYVVPPSEFRLMEVVNGA